MISYLKIEMIGFDGNEITVHTKLTFINNIIINTLFEIESLTLILILIHYIHATKQKFI